ncbi:MAG TPA: DUF5685 family protein [Candidatus Acidoferrum sp.]|nr:DUF5685 family protein [Candidatus Acidoferrum sp.]
MFGYIVPKQEELRMRELEAYKAIYCGLCHRLKETYGGAATMGLSYDFAFLACLAMALDEEEPAYAKRMCATNPLKNTGALSSEASLDTVAAAHVILGCGKLRDDLADENGAKRAKAKAALLALSSAEKLARTYYPALASGVDGALTELAAAEGGPPLTLDGYTRHFAGMLAAVTESLSEDAVVRRVLHELGYQVGRWIYLIDAADDLPEDKKLGRFNPLVAAGLDGDMPLVVQMLTDAAFGAASSLDLLPLKRYRGILENILRVGMPAKQRGITHEKPV